MVPLQTPGEIPEGSGEGIPGEGTLQTPGEIPEGSGEGIPGEVSEGSGADTW